VLYAKQDFIAANPNTIQALVNAFYKTLKWIATATTDEIVNTVPQEYFFGDRDIYVKALRANLLVYSKTGMITPAGMKSARDVLVTFDPELKGADINLQKTFDEIRETGDGSIRRSKRCRAGERRSKTRDGSPVDEGLTRCDLMRRAAKQ
jgi:ABC-type nitrate/sulfonate/bicarbonate transport system substrate-binding protein